MNFLRVIFTSGCRLVKLNHLNVNVLCDWFNFIMLFSVSLEILYLICHNKLVSGLGFFILRDDLCKI
jgi:hypothetical protein